jgi:8-oxo-dGTP pyrophosphatase MutT (NUDIX family)
MSPLRIDYYDSPDAPRANSLVPAVNVVIVNCAGEILLIRRTDNGNWAVPGGAVDLGESVRRSARRSRSPGSSARSPGSRESTPTPGT